MRRVHLIRSARELGTGPEARLGPTALALWGWSPVARYAQATTPTVHDPVKVPFLTGLALLLPTLTPQVAPPV